MLKLKLNGFVSSTHFRKRLKLNSNRNTLSSLGLSIIMLQNKVVCSVRAYFVFYWSRFNAFISLRVGG